MTGLWGLVFCAFLFFIFPAQAARYCDSPAVLNKKVKDCNDNEIFAGAAVECLEKFEKAVGVGKAAVTKGMAAKAKASHASQSDKQKNSMLDYALSAASLDALIKLGEQAQTETAKYYDSVVWPEDFDEPQVTGPDLDAFLNSDPCYKDNRDLIANVLEDFDSQLNQLREARDAAKTLEKAAGGRKTSLDSVGAGAVSSGKKGKLPVAKGKKKSKKDASDVTGTQQDREKRALKK